MAGGMRKPWMGEEKKREEFYYEEISLEIVLAIFRYISQGCCYENMRYKGAPHFAGTMMLKDQMPVPKKTYTGYLNISAALLFYF